MSSYRTLAGITLIALLVFAYNNCSGVNGLLGRNGSGPGSFLGSQLGTSTAGNGMNCDVACLPKVILNSDYPAGATGVTLEVGTNKAFSDCQAAIDAARPGDTVVIDPGFVCGPIILADKGSSDQYIVIKSAALNELPEGTRLTRDKAASLAVIETTSSKAAIGTTVRAHQYYLAGLEIRVSSAFAALSNGLVTFGSPSETSFDEVPHDIVLARSWIHASPTQEIQKGIVLNASAISIVDSIIEEIHAHSDAAPAIAGWNVGFGPFKIQNNEIESAGAAFAIGGGEVTIPDLIPSDMEFRGNYVHKNTAWRQPVTSATGQTGPWWISNFMMFTNAQRILIENNLFEENWEQGLYSQYKNGQVLMIIPRSASLWDGPEQTAMTWARVRDITFRNNVARHLDDGISIQFQDPQNPVATAENLKFENNLFYDVGTPDTSFGMVNLLSNAHGPVSFDHNTLLMNGTTTKALIHAAPGSSVAEFVFTNNLTSNTGTGVFNESTGTGAATLNAFFPGVTFAANVLSGQDPANYGPFANANYFPSSVQNPPQRHGWQADRLLVGLSPLNSGWPKDRAVH